jgi:hypothetical protein
MPASNTFDSFLVGYYEGRDLMYAGRIRAGLAAESRRALLFHFAGLSIEHCPFSNLPERTEGRWGEGLTAEDMAKCRWLAPRLVAMVVQHAAGKSSSGAPFVTVIRERTAKVTGCRHPYFAAEVSPNGSSRYARTVGAARLAKGFSVEEAARATATSARTLARCTHKV